LDTVFKGQHPRSIAIGMISVHFKLCWATKGANKLS
jgi:hypothetical protein